LVKFGFYTGLSGFSKANFLFVWVGFGFAQPTLILFISSGFLKIIRKIHPCELILVPFLEFALKERTQTIITKATGKPS
jgi:hypothetical protein